jgi:hypothetical protein
MLIEQRAATEQHDAMPTTIQRAYIEKRQIIRLKWKVVLFLCTKTNQLVAGATIIQ